MNIQEREKLKQRIEEDLQILINESWHVNVIENLQQLLNDLKDIWLEGYDD
jgi:hypothetical protein